jgi:hypothetical protein
MTVSSEDFFKVSWDVQPSGCLQSSQDTVFFAKNILRPENDVVIYGCG